MLAVHFGAGNIGRGFIGALLYEAKYRTIFVDVNQEVIDRLNKENQYEVILAGATKKKQVVKQVSGINSVTNPVDVVAAIEKADIVTTAVGPTILKVIAKLIATGLEARVAKNAQPLNIIACENMLGGSTLLKEEVLSHVTEEIKHTIEQYVGFPDAAVDRIVPNQVNDDRLQVAVEPYYEWVVEKPALKGKTPVIDGVTYVEDLKPYIERKLFTVNTGHAVPAYIGHQKGYPTIYEAMQDEEIQAIIDGALQESGEALIQFYGFNRHEHAAYRSKIIERFKNPHISDEVTRVGRGPIRKLGARDRLIRPAILYMEQTGKIPSYLVKTIAAALTYGNIQDEEAVNLQVLVNKEGYANALQIVAELSAEHPLVDAVIKEINK
ncbi:mannitol-1-phosphate 5-dehydrogenase [Virgibacillus salexigens]|uniref:Mannitol-1-phosphate 5-dehydrogenase n=1 Tax=Virgibacillus kapii TaxID=1638645 RepID=A0ABQ2DYD0_9BACI|nr:mannitol-1-phosphate 5-dehydrogenase [Virgibacillus kapii]GGJ72884.1 mannitol-1-phosphate 5-dehydrogenase [Virgibacillus kapii]